MNITFHRYSGPAGVTAEALRLRAFFLKRLGDDFPFGRWDWMITHAWLDHDALGNIGVWEDNGEVVGVAAFDTQPGEGFICVLPGYEGLRAEMVRYASANIRSGGKFRLLILDQDTAFQKLAAEEEFIATPEKEFDVVFDNRDISKIFYVLPEGFRVVGSDEVFDLEKYGQVLWKGFNHEQNSEGPLELNEAKRKKLVDEMFRPNVNLHIKIAVLAPNGIYASYCGMWQDDASPDALVEPVATDPAYRGLSLGKAAVLEGVRLYGLLGAQRALVGSR